MILLALSPLLIVILLALAILVFDFIRRKVKRKRALERALELRKLRHLLCTTDPRASLKKITAGEEIADGDIVYIGGDGRVYRAK